MQFINAIQSTLAKYEMPTIEIPKFEISAFAFSDVARHVDGYCSAYINNVVEFLDKHPGISMMLSPSTVLHRCAQKHVDERIGQLLCKEQSLPSVVNDVPLLAEMSASTSY